MFHYLQACSMALNSSTVLFIGLSNASDPYLTKTNSLYDSFRWSYIKNDISASYNFDYNTWTQHESLNYPSHATTNGVTFELDHGYEVLCSPYHGKNESKILVISFMVDNYQHFAKKYHPFAWTSSIDTISWNFLEVKNKDFDIPGTY